MVGNLLERHEGIVGDRRGPSEQEARALDGADHDWPKGRCGGRAQHDLAGIGGPLHRHNGAGTRTGNDELAVRVADKEEVEETAMDSH